MTPLLFSILASLSLSQTPYQSAAPAAPTPQGAPQAAAPTAPAATDLNIPVIEGAQASPDCGGRAEVAAQAFCVSAPLTAMEAVADQYNAAFAAQGWVAAAGDDNRIVYVRRREGGGCTAFQLLAFANEDQADTNGYFAFAAIPGDICADQPAAPAAPPAQ